jgi:hypothetical protein
MTKTQDAATKVGRGRPKTAPDTISVTITIPRRESKLAESMVPDFDQLALGLRHTRMDVLRAAISRGLDALKAELEHAQHSK